MVINSHNLDNIVTIDQMHELADRGLFDRSLIPLRPGVDFFEHDPNNPTDENGLPDDTIQVDSDSAFYEGGDF